MQQYWRKRVLMVSLLLIVVSVAVMAGCTSKGEEGNSSTEKPKVTETNQTEPKESDAGPPVEISISTPEFEKSFPAGYQDDPVAKEIEKRLNIKLNIIPMNAVGDVNAKFAAQLASGDLPDIAYVVGNNMYSKILAAKAAYPMDDLLETYGQNIMKETPLRIDFARKFLSKNADGSSDGKMYFLGLRGDTDVDPISVGVAPNLRYDLWKQLGFPKLETMDDYLPVLQQMMELEPKNANGEKNYGVSAWFGDAAGWGNWVLDPTFSFMKGIAQIKSVDIDMHTYKATSRLTEPNSTFWEAIEWYNKANRMGVLDPDSFTMKFDDYLNKAAANRFFFGWGGWLVDGGNLTFSNNGQTDKGYFQMPAPNQLDQYLVALDQALGGPRVFISKNSKHPEKAMELLNFLISTEGTELILNGVKGVHWDEVDGKPMPKPEVLQGLKDDPDYKLKTGIYKYHNIAGRGNSFIDPKYGAPVNFRYLPEVVKERLTPIQIEGSKHFNVELPGDTITKVKTYTTYDASLDQSLPAMPDDLQEINNKAIDLSLQIQIKMISYKDEAKFKSEKEKFIEEIRKLGIDRVVEWYNTEIPKLLEGRKK